MIRAVIFDFDGILADTEKLHFRSYLKPLQAAGIEFTYTEYCDRYMAFDSRGCLQARATDQGIDLSPDELEAWIEQKNNCFQALITEAEVDPLPGALEAVKFAAQQGPVAVCTGAIRSDIATLLDRFGLTPLLQTVVTAEDVPRSKPDPACYALTAERLALPPSECLAIEDTPGGLQAARGAGCRTLGVTTTHRTEELAPFADTLLESLVDFPAALSTMGC
jgi:beta-phosphoglucomutase